MPIQVKQPGGMHGSFLTNMLGVFNTAKGAYNQMKGGTGSEASGGTPTSYPGDPNAGVNYFNGPNPYASAEGGDAAVGDAAAGDAAASEAGTSGAAILDLAKGGLVPGRAKVPGNSFANDTVSIKASPGEIVIPRTTAEKGGKAIENFALEAMQRRMSGRR